MHQGITLHELGLKFDLAMVTWVQEIMWPEDVIPNATKTVALEVHFVGGSNPVVLPNWTLVKWTEMEEKYKRFMHLQINPLTK